MSDLAKRMEEWAGRIETTQTVGALRDHVLDDIVQEVRGFADEVETLEKDAHKWRTYTVQADRAELVNRISALEAGHEEAEEWCRGYRARISDLESEVEALEKERNDFGERLSHEENMNAERDVYIRELESALGTAIARADAIAEVSNDEKPPGNVKMTDKDCVLWIVEHAREALNEEKT